MNCETARQWLEARRDDADPQDVLPDDLVEHLEACAACRGAQHAIATLDRAIARRMRNIPVPDGLRNRLLDRLASAPALTDPAHADFPTSGPVEAPPSNPNQRRRRWFGRAGRRTYWIAAAGSLAAAVVLVVLLLGRDARWTLADVQQLVRESAFDKLVLEGTNHDPVLPSGLRRDAFLDAREKILEGRRITVLRYRVPAIGITCEVYVIPKEFLSSDVPNFSDMVPTTGAGKTLAVWQEDDHVFAFVSRGAGGEDLLQRLRPRPELT